MLSDVGKKGGPRVNCWREFIDMLWRECGPNWYWQWPPSHCTLVDRELLGHHLLLRLDLITQLGGMAMSGTSKVRFPRHGTLICAAITLDEPDFHTENDEGKHIWNTSWKWFHNQAPVSLKNRLSEYPTPKLLQGEYEQELQAWIQNG